MEGLLKKRIGDNTHYYGFGKLKGYCDKVKIFHPKRWFVLKDTFITYLKRDRHDQVGFVMLFDRSFSCKMKFKPDAYHAIVLKNLERTLVLKCKNSQQQKEWYHKIMNSLLQSGRFFTDLNLLPNGSFAPIRKNQLCKWYINGSLYMEHVMHAINNAKEQIFIADWWLSPELFLKRPTNNLEYRLDKLLLKKSRDGIKIYILLYQEVSLVVNLMSSRVKRILSQNGANPNIKVLRHPEHNPNGTLLWTHHEKCVVIDQSIAFLGGIDLCFGRWDDDLHRLVDLGNLQNITELNQSVSDKFLSSINILRDIEKRSQISKVSASDQSSEKFSNSSFSNSISEKSKSVFSGIKSVKKNYKNANSPDAMLIAALMGKSDGAEASSKTYQNNDLKPANEKNLNEGLPIINKILKNQFFSTIHFGRKEKAKEAEDIDNEDEISKFHELNLDKLSISDKSFSDKTIDTDSLEETKSNCSTKRDSVRKKWNKFKMTVKLKRSHLHHKNVSEDSNENSLSEEDVEIPTIISNESYYWLGKDYSNTYKGDFKDISDFSTDQYNRLEIPRMPWRDQSLVIFGESARDVSRHFIQRWNQCKRDKVKNMDAYPFLLPKQYSDNIDYQHHMNWLGDTKFNCDIQIIRSLDRWSGGISETENSILQSYCDLIRKSQHYIYIENQFFVTTTNENDPEVKNTIGLELVNRIIKAHKENKKFRVYVVLPLLPGFDNKNAINAVQYYNLRSIILGEYSIYKSLIKSGISDPSKYITFHGMRNWSILMGKLVQEIIYVHSKLMIVDDNHVICGSANINDRSMLGKRDSELAAVVHDTEFIDSVQNGKSVKVGKYAFSLRKKIFKLHLGIYFNNPKRIRVDDCTSDQFYDYFREVSQNNTLAYDEVFKCIPSDNILNFDALAKYGMNSNLSKTNPKLAKEKMEKEVNGYVVDFPLKFLSNEEEFYPSVYSLEWFAPSMFWK